jgi:hypothetical protein
MKLLLARDTLTDESTTGKLYMNGRFWCYTLEDKTRPHKDYGETCIPCGAYKIDLYFWHKHRDWFPHLCNVPDYNGVLIHKGNTNKDTLGCILVGMDRGVDRISNCAVAFDPLKANIAEALKVDEVSIEVTESDDRTDNRTDTSS